MKREILASVVLACAAFAYADSMEEARQLVVSGDYENARKMASSLASKDAKIASTPLYNYIIGVCDFEDGDFNGARKHLETSRAKGYGPAYLYLGRLAFLDYDFEKAQDLYGEFRRYRDK
ncbi:MAG: hypothetical protein K2J78_11125, partial [Muribaculaceae bacterium]|nr:hypothetical protein [Muribaculaceae bacterium]